jgi:triosephosphate isomerase (TIM)
MRKKIAAANWKMNLTWQEGASLVEKLVKECSPLSSSQLVILAVPFPYLNKAQELVQGRSDFSIAAQNCHHKAAGAYTGEVSASMLQSIGIQYCIVGHSERREYQSESNSQLAEKLSLCFAHEITPIFCCGESLPTRESGEQNSFVQTQLQESLFKLTPEQISKTVIAYEPIWAIGTGKTATTAQAQEIHHFIRKQLATTYGDQLAAQVSILYGGSVKASNASELFSCLDVDGGLVGGASLQATEFSEIVAALP